MAKKAKSTKKHRLKYAQPTTEARPVMTETQSHASVAKPQSQQPGLSARVATLPGRDFRFVARDLRRLSLYASGLVVFEFILWFLMTYTAFGTAVYRLIQV